LDKGRFGTLLAEMPVQIILEPKTALLGAAQAALQQATVHAGVADDRRYAVHRGDKHSSVAARA
jgi:hypothetical protein